jgi:hypothetical protein
MPACAGMKGASGMTEVADMPSATHLRSEAFSTITA